MYFPRIGMITSIVCIIVAIALFPLSQPILRWARNITAKFPGKTPLAPVPSSASAALASQKASSGIKAFGSVATMPRTPVYFFSHGGPNIMEDYDHPAYRKLGELGREITEKVRPKAVVVFSAHWQAGRSSVQVNTAEITQLIYDYYGFPAHYYKIQYPNVGSKDLAEKVLSKLHEAGISAEPTKRGLDHGVFAPFRVAFDPDKNPLKVPIVQVSLFDNDDPIAHHQLGRALTSLRDEGVLVIVSGMAVHNLRDLWTSMSRPGNMPYTESFDEALRDAVEQEPEARKTALAALLKRSDARKAHPSFEHLLPIHIGAGAAGDDMGKRVWTMPEGSMSWAQYRFGEVANVTA